MNQFRERGENLNIGIVGATGVVGETFLQLLEERNFPVKSLKLFASQSSAGKSVSYGTDSYTIETLQDGCFAGLDLVFFSSGNDISREWAPKAVEQGAFAVDNSSAFRLDTDVPLVVPEVNSNALPKTNEPSIIANPNCSTIQMVAALAPLKKFGLAAVKVSTYQSASGAGKEGILELTDQMHKFSRDSDSVPEHSTFAAPLIGNCIPQIGDFGEDGFSTEERKMILETKKILELPQLPVSAFTVRVPTMVGHAESVWVSLNETVEKNQVLDALAESPGLNVDPEGFHLVSDSAGTDPVFVGRVHRDLDDPKTWLMWVVADNVRKGAALNGLQIAEKLFL